MQRHVTLDFSFKPLTRLPPSRCYVTGLLSGPGAVADQPASVPAPPVDIRSALPASAVVTRLRPARLAA